jgi:hypothetical protein
MPRLVIPPLRMSGRELQQWYAANGIAPAPSSSFALKRARQARFYARRRAAGLCKVCGEPTGNDLSRCDACRAERRRKEQAHAP